MNNSNTTETPLSRDQALKLIYRHTHRDYRGKLADGTKSILTIRGIVALDDLTEAEVSDRLPLARRKEAERLQAKAPKVQEFQQLPHPSIIDPFEDGRAVRSKGGK
ncbi:hypothetical protein SAMN05216370_0165 [Pseudomonas peli]|uniref:Uncharacterized protein n=1 Tax=Pseudomonas peli TaxID=592361 RepID=A0AB37ZDK2_9PSED|nr:hypothetical protein [Pseudomonas peli]NMZ71357.1 hypothetical protein [Pseudomonas peli]SCW90642.1 hypothetical protein SAMN05216370_0165 [Pseudomonas peli]